MRPLPALMVEEPKCASCGGPCDRCPNVDVCAMCSEKVHDISINKHFEYSKSCAIVHFMQCAANPLVVKQ